MKKNDITKLITVKFGKLFKEIGFRKWQYGYEVEVGSFFYVFGFSSLDRDNSFPTTFYYNLGSKSVQNILYKCITVSGKYSILLGVGQQELFAFKKFPIPIYDIKNENDVEEMVNDVFKYFKGKILPFLHEISNTESIERIINSEMNPRKANAGLILAKLVNNPNYENLKQEYRLLLTEWPNSRKEELELVIKFLDTHSSDELLNIGMTE